MRDAFLGGGGARRRGGLVLAGSLGRGGLIRLLTQVGESAGRHLAHTD